MAAKRGIQLCMIILFSLVLISPYILSFVDAQQIELNGVWIPNEKEEYTLGTLWNGQYQNAYDAWFSDHFPYRAYFVSLYSQLRFTLFHTSTSTVVGNHNYLFDSTYIRSALGLQRAVEPEVKQYAACLKSIQDKCDILGKDFLFYIPPNKTEFYDNMVPLRYKLAAMSNEDPHSFPPVLRDALQEAGVRFFDASEYLWDIRDQVSFPLFTQNGIHWSAMTAAYCAKEMIENPQYGLTPETFPSISAKSTEEAIGTSNDLMLLNNLIWPVNETYFYPVYDSYDGEKYTIFQSGSSFQNENMEALTQSGIADKIYAVRYTQELYTHSFDDQGNFTPTGERKDIREMGLEGMLQESDILLFSNHPAEYSAPLLDAAIAIDEALAMIP